MTSVVVVVALIAGVGAAARSTYSPCGLSMLSSITPFGERSRGYRYWVTAAWFVAGALAGGASMGGVAAGAAAVVSATGLPRHPGAVAAVGGLAAVAGAAVDAGLFGPVLPLVRRQVDDRWLVRYRRWVYGAGFGWQIGTGFATYLMTSTVVLVTVLGALSGSPVAAVLVGTGFGLARGLTVFLTAGAGTPARLRTLHRALDAAGPDVAAVVVGLQLSAGVALGWAGLGRGAVPPLPAWAAGGVVLVGATVGFVTRRLAALRRGVPRVGGASG